MKGLRGLLRVVILFMISRVARSMTASSSTPSSKLVYHWFRHGDLRVHDNPALVHSARHVCVPIFVFDPQMFGDCARTPFGTLKVGPKRAKFILESVADLRQQLESRGSALAVVHQEPAQLFDRLFQGRKNSSICVQQEVLKEECDAVRAVEAAIQRHEPQTKVEQVWGSTMYELQDLPFDANLGNMPDVFTPFRNKVEKSCKIARPLPPPKKLLMPAQDSPEFRAVESYLAYLPTLAELGYTDKQIAYAESNDPRGVMEFKGGETAALERVENYIWKQDCLKVYFDTRNGMLGADYSTKFSPWLAHGCLSPREVARQCQKYEQEVVANKSTYWVVFELLWRDYCKFFCLKHGNSIFFPSGTAGKHKKWSSFAKNFEAWKNGQTGYPLVDANMRELHATGFMSNRGRQNVCSFLAIDLNHDWRYGADWFESHLLDYDVYSNWYNWCAGAGMTGGRLNRFNIVKQAKDYDQHGEYVKHWIPELRNVPKELVHEPWKMTQFQQMEYGVKLGVDYPNPIVPPTQPKYSDKKKGQTPKQRKPNRNNRHQKYEMKSVKQGSFDIR